MTTEKNDEKIKPEAEEVLITEGLLVPDAEVVKEETASVRVVRRLKREQESKRALQRELNDTQEQLNRTEKKLEQKSKAFKESEAERKKLEKTLSRVQKELTEIKAAAEEQTTMAETKAKNDIGKMKTRLNKALEDVKQENQSRILAEEKLEQITTEAGKEKERAEIDIAKLQEEFYIEKDSSTKMIEQLQWDLYTEKESSTKTIEQLRWDIYSEYENAKNERESSQQIALNAKDEEITKLREALESERRSSQMALTAKDEEIAKLREALVLEKKSSQIYAKSKGEGIAQSREEPKLEIKKLTPKVKLEPGKSGENSLKTLVDAINSADPEVEGSDTEALRLLEEYPKIYTAKNLNPLLTPEQGKSGQRVLLIVVKQKLLNIVKALLQRGVNINVKSGGGGSGGLASLHIAVTNEDYAMIGLLLQQELIDINIKDAAGNTPLHHAVALNDEESVRLIMAENPNLMIQNKARKTVIDCAKQNANAAIKKLLGIPDNIAQSTHTSNGAHAPGEKKFSFTLFNTPTIKTEQNHSSPLNTHSHSTAQNPTVSPSSMLPQLELRKFVQYVMSDMEAQHKLQEPQVKHEASSTTTVTTSHTAPQPQSPVSTVTNSNSFFQINNDAKRGTKRAFEPYIKKEPNPTEVNLPKDNSGENQGSRIKKPRLEQKNKAVPLPDNQTNQTDMIANNGFPKAYGFR